MSDAIDEQRRGQRYATLLERFFREAPESDPSGADEAAARLERWLAVSLATLPDDERELLERKYLLRPFPLSLHSQDSW